MTKCFIQEQDLFLNEVLSQEETIDMFGEQFIDEDAGEKWHELPEDLYLEYRKLYKKLFELNQKIKVFNK